MQKKELDTIFCTSELSAEYTAHCGFVVVVLSNARMGVDNECHSVASLFHASRPAFVKYIANAEEMQSCLTRKLKESKPFAKFLERVANKTEYMDDPISRIFSSCPYNDYLDTVSSFENFWTIYPNEKVRDCVLPGSDQTLGQVEQYVEFEVIEREARGSSITHLLTHITTRVSQEYHSNIKDTLEHIEHRYTSAILRVTTVWSELQD